MKQLSFHFDVVSPYAYLAFEALPQALAGCSHVVDYRPLLFAGLLKHWGQKGPVEIEPKREWTWRHVAWLARVHGIPFSAPRTHPFNPLALLRLALACAAAGELPNRLVVEAVLRHVWRADGADALDAARLQALTAELNPVRDPAGADVKRELRALTEAAIAAGVFGVPTIVADGRIYWGLDSLSMLAAHLRDA